MNNWIVQIISITPFSSLTFPNWDFEWISFDCELIVPSSDIGLMSNFHIYSQSRFGFANCRWYVFNARENRLCKISIRACSWNDWLDIIQVYKQSITVYYKLLVYAQLMKLSVTLAAILLYNCISISSWCSMQLFL